MWDGFKGAISKIFFCPMTQSDHNIPAGHWQSFWSIPMTQQLLCQKLTFLAFRNVTLCGWCHNISALKAKQPRCRAKQQMTKQCYCIPWTEFNRYHVLEIVKHYRSHLHRFSYECSWGYNYWLIPSIFAIDIVVRPLYLLIFVAMQQYCLKREQFVLKTILPQTHCLWTFYRSQFLGGKMSKTT